MSMRSIRRSHAACAARTRDSRAAPGALAFGLALWLLAMGAAWSAAAEGTITPDDVNGPLTWGTATRVTQLHHLYLADQPDARGFEAAKAAGVVAVIDLRAPDERDWDERAVVEKLGLAYENVPVTGDSFDPAAFERIEALVAERHPEKILLHCSSSDRAGGWLATHLVAHHGLTEEDALAVGRRAGITKEKIEGRVRAYLQERSKE